MKQGAEWGMIHAPGGNKQHPSCSFDMDAALAKGDGCKNYFIVAICGIHFAKGMKLKNFLCFLFCGKTAPCTRNKLFSQMIRIGTVPLLPPIAIHLSNSAQNCCHQKGILVA